jgi:hypothetical protein
LENDAEQLAMQHSQEHDMRADDSSRNDSSALG